MQELSAEAGGTSRFPPTPSTGPLRGQDASASSARISASNEPEQPVEAAFTANVLDDSSKDATVTALAEPERIEPGGVETEEFLAPVPTERDSSGAAMIVFEGVQKIYEPGVTALDGVSFTIEKGEFVFVVGASGSGKSTVIRLILKELEPTQGRIVVGGRDLGRLKRSKVPLLRRNVGCVFQDFKLLPNRTAAENIAYALRVQGQSSAQIRKKVPEVLNLVGLPHKMNSRPEELSGGEQQRVSIARAFVNHPPLLVCDEPTGNLDPDTSVGIMQLLYRISRTGTTILMVTHDREMVDKMRRRVIALESGKLVRDERRGGYAEE
jgi:cell division transport system ATP-binding protein